MNKKPSTYTALYWLIQDEKMDPKVLFDLLELYWPTFTKKDKFVFLKEEFSKEEYNRLINENLNPEYWINLLTINDFFSGIPNEKKYSVSLTKALVKIWEIKLKNDFPSMSFIVEFLYDEEYGDYGLTFYQKNDQN